MLTIPMLVFLRITCLCYLVFRFRCKYHRETQRATATGSTPSLSLPSRLSVQPQPTFSHSRPWIRFLVRDLSPHLSSPHHNPHQYLNLTKTQRLHKKTFDIYTIRVFETVILLFFDRRCPEACVLCC